MSLSVYMAMVSLPPLDTTTAAQLGVQLWLMRLVKAAWEGWEVGGHGMGWRG